MKTARDVRAESGAAESAARRATDPALQPRLRGAATLVIQQHFGAPNIA